jgi:hypothetical protein
MVKRYDFSPCDQKKPPNVSLGGRSSSKIVTSISMRVGDYAELRRTTPNDGAVS